MKLRLAWLGDAENEDSYSAREARVVLKALARSSDIQPLWFAVGASEPPHIWNGIPVFPVPKECMVSSTFLQTLLSQQRPQVVLTSLPASALSGIREYLNRENMRWIHRIIPDDIQSVQDPSVSTILVGEESQCANFSNSKFVPYLEGADPAIRHGADPTAMLQRLKDVIVNGSGKRPVNSSGQTHLVMRQQLFCNSSVAQVMFELTNALIELGIPTVPQEEHAIFSQDGYILREEELVRSGAPDKYERIRRCLGTEYDPESSITIHFALLQSLKRITRYGTFQSLCGREVLYTTGNHAVASSDVRQLMGSFGMVLAPSKYVLQPYFEAGLSRKCGAVIPHGIDPLVYSPKIAPFQYSTKKRFKFLQTSFPWVHEKGFDLTIKAFSRAFSYRDDVSLILRIPRIKDPSVRKSRFGRLEALVQEALVKPGAPEILLLEMDVELNRRGGIYTGADCYVHPLRAEGFGMTILEAMACGLPVIATPWSGSADFLSPRWAYLLHHSGPVPEKAKDGKVLRYHVEPELDHLVSLMRYTYEHEDEGNTLGQKAAHVAREEWTWRHAAAKLALLFFQASLPVSSDGHDMKP